MAVDPASAAVHFCETLRRLVHGCGIAQKELARSLHRAESTVSELLLGRRSTPPRLDLVLEIVRYCGEHAGENRPPGLSLDPTWWRTRYAELEHAFETPRPRPPVRTAAEPPLRLEDERIDFADAVDVLWTGPGRSGEVAERLLEPLTLAGSGGGPVRDLFEDYPERVRASCGTTRTALLRAADVVVHITAFCEAVRSCGITPGLRWETRAADLTTEVLDELGRVDLGSARVRDPQELRDEIIASYRAAAGIVHGAALSGQVPGALARHATRNHDRLLAPLTWACPELRLTSDSGPVAEDHDEPPHEGTGLTLLGELLTGFADGGRPPARHSARLRGPIASLDEAGAVLPTLAEGYVDPAFRVAPYPVHRDPASDEWWEGQPLRDGLGTFLATHLLTSRAVRAPLLVLGHPGSGKSLLTRLVEARLPEDEFFCVRVELRHVPADTDVQGQIEAGLRLATGRHTPWPDAVDPESGVMRVVLLDGFDELLQAGAHHLDARRQWAYLRDVELFQEREAEWGRPTAVIVTSRTVVADRFHIPATTTVLRLEPFDDARIDRWLAVWERANGRTRRAGPLTRDALAPHRELIGQPLLLLMLALYHAAGGPLLGERGEGMGRVELYERLLRRFVRREVARRRDSMPPSEEKAAVEEELLFLGTVAMGMFNRRSQSIMAKDAEQDLAVLLGERGSPLLFGRFFFVHESQAVAADEEIRSYEFLHATFGEYLVARSVCGELGRVLAGLHGGEDEGPGRGDAGPDDSRLRALLSAVPLTDRIEVVRNVAELLRRDGAGHGGPATGALRDLFARVPAGVRTDLPYGPLPSNRTERDAVYGANLLLLAVLGAGEEGLAASAFLSADAPAELWWRYAHLWRSQLGGASWNALSHALVPRWFFSDGEVVPRDLCLFLRDDTEPDDGADAGDGSDDEPGGTLSTWRQGARPLPTGPALDVAGTLRKVSFLADVPTGHLVHAAFPLLERLPGTADTYHVDPVGGVRSVAHVLLGLVCGTGGPVDALSAAYEDVVSVLHRLPDITVARVTDLVACHLLQDAPRLPGTTVLAVLKALTAPVSGRPVPDVAAETWPALLRCVETQCWRADVPQDELERVATSLSVLLTREDLRHRGRGDGEAVRELTTALRGAGSTRLWHAMLPERGSGDRLLDAARRTAARTPGPARDPEAVVGALRLARELGRSDWLSEHAEPLLRTLGPASLGLLLPSDVDFLRPLVRDAALLGLFARIEEVWRGERGAGPAYGAV